MGKQMEFVDSYRLKIVLEEDETIWEEVHRNISLSDFEVIYGNISANIIYCELRLVGYE